MPFVLGFLALCGLITSQATGTSNAVVSRHGVSGGSRPSSPPDCLHVLAAQDSTGLKL